ncbi:MAG TPA: hypothetical protein VFF65_12130 [Phycisphaerales bacterium]|nr:hypothetical protein [Phycisphaerales bacterium]
MANAASRVNLNRAGRQRRAAGWTLLTLGAIVAGVCVASGWWGLTVQFEWWSFGVHKGTAYLIENDKDWTYSKTRATVVWGDPQPGRLDVRRLVRREWEWTRPAFRKPMEYSGSANLGPGNPRKWFWGINGYRTTFPLWPIPLLLWTPAAILLRLGTLARRRALKGMCAKCGYSLAGLSNGAACPECGKGSSPLVAQVSSLKTPS